MTIASFDTDKDAIYSGFIAAAGGTDFLPAGWSVVKPSTGVYRIFHNLGLAEPMNMRVVLTSFGNDNAPVAWRMHVRRSNANRFVVHIEDVNEQLANDAFFFVAIHVS